MKRMIVAILAVLMLSSLTACVQAPDAPAQETAGKETDQTTAATPATEAFEEMVLVDDENCTFKITATGTDSIWGYTLKVFLENKTDLDLMFSLEDVSVNGYMCDPFWASSVAAGKKANEEISFFDSDFEKNGITEVSEITFTLNVYDSNDWSADHLVKETFTIHP